MNHKETIPDGASAPSSNTDAINPLDVQVGGAHYREGGIQPVEYIEANKLGFLEGCVVKRVTRHGRDGGKGRQDIEKAIHELQLLLKLRYPAAVKGGAMADDLAIEGAHDPVNPIEVEHALAKAEVLAFYNEAHDLAEAEVRSTLLHNFFREYGPANRVTEIPDADIGRFRFSLAEARQHLERGCANVRMHYDPKFAPESNGIYLSWAEPKTDPQNEKTDSENPKCEATEAKSEANYGVHYSGIRAGMSGEANPAEPKPEAASKIVKGDLVTYRGMPYRVHSINAAYGYALIKPDLDPRHWITTDLFVPIGDLTLAKTDSSTPEPPAAEPQSEAPKVVNTLNIDIGAGNAAMAKTFVRAIPNPTRYLGKHPALGASYELGKGGIASLNFDSPFHAGGIVDRGEAVLPKGEEATAASEAWTPKSGDRVRVVRRITSHAGWKNYWLDLMDGAIGQVGRVKHFTDEDRRDNMVELEFEGDPEWSGFFYPIPALERVTDAEG